MTATPMTIWCIAWTQVMDMGFVDTDTTFPIDDEQLRPLPLKKLIGSDGVEKVSKILKQWESPVLRSLNPALFTGAMRWMMQVMQGVGTATLASSGVNQASSTYHKTHGIFIGQDDLGHATRWLIEVNSAEGKVYRVPIVFNASLPPDWKSIHEQVLEGDGDNAHRVLSRYWAVRSIEWDQKEQIGVIQGMPDVSNGEDFYGAWIGWAFDSTGTHAVNCAAQLTRINLDVPTKFSLHEITITSTSGVPVSAVTAVLEEGNGSNGWSFLTGVPSEGSERRNIPPEHPASIHGIFGFDYGTYQDRYLTSGSQPNLGGGSGCSSLWTRGDKFASFLSPSVAAYFSTDELYTSSSPMFAYYNPDDTLHVVRMDYSEPDTRGDKATVIGDIALEIGSGVAVFGNKQQSASHTLAAGALAFTTLRVDFMGSNSTPYLVYTLYVYMTPESERVKYGMAGGPDRGYLDQKTSYHTSVPGNGNITIERDFGMTSVTSPVVGDVISIAPEAVKRSCVVDVVFGEPIAQEPTMNYFFLGFSSMGMYAGGIGEWEVPTWRIPLTVDAEHSLEGTRDVLVLPGTDRTAYVVVRSKIKMYGYKAHAYSPSALTKLGEEIPLPMPLMPGEDKVAWYTVLGDQYIPNVFFTNGVILDSESPSREDNITQAVLIVGDKSYALNANLLEHPPFVHEYVDYFASNQTNGVGIKYSVVSSGFYQERVAYSPYINQQPVAAGFNYPDTENPLHAFVGVF